MLRRATPFADMHMCSLSAGFALPPRCSAEIMLAEAQDGGLNFSLILPPQGCQARELEYD